MSSYIHLIVFIIIWPISPIYLISTFDIESWFFRFVIFGVFGPLALIGSTLVTLIFSAHDREQFKERWEADNERERWEADRER